MNEMKNPDNKMMEFENNIWTAISANKHTGEVFEFYIYKDGKKMTFTPDEAKELFPDLMTKHERSVMMFRIYG